jgi:plasmid stability protein
MAARPENQLTSFLVFWYSGPMKATIEIPDELMREIKVRAARQDRTLKDLVAELLRRGLAEDPQPPPIRHRVKLPLIHSTHPALPGQELTPERIAQILNDEEVSWYTKG